MSLFSGLLSTLNYPENELEDVFHSHTTLNNITCIVVVGSVFLMYLVFLVWSRAQDKKDFARVIILINDTTN